MPMTNENIKVPVDFENKMYEVLYGKINLSDVNGNKA